MHLTGLQAATPFLGNLGLLLLTTAITGWIRLRVAALYSATAKAKEVTLPTFARPEALGRLAVWSIDIGTLFGTLAVTATATAGLIQTSNLSLVIYGAMVATLVSFALALRFVSPLRYDKWLLLKVSYLVWLGLLLNGALVIYSFAHYGK